MQDWQQLADRLGKVPDEDADDVVDEIVGHLLSATPGDGVGAIAVKALSAARSDLSIRDAALAVACVAADDDTEAVDGLEQAYEGHRNNAFLAPSLLNAITLLGLRSQTAQAGAVRYLVRLKGSDVRPVLVAGAKCAGLLYDREPHPELRSKLFALAGHADPAVCAEARYQVALLRLADAFLAGDSEGLAGSLAAAREAFRVAETSEELRPDAALFHLLLDAILAFNDLEQDRNAAHVAVKALAAELRERGGRLAEQIFRMDRSPAAEQVAGQCAVVATALEEATAEVAVAVRWTNYDRSVVKLADCYGAVRYRPNALPGNERAVSALSGVADRVLKPRLGPVLSRKVGRDSLEQVIRNYEESGGRDETLAGLRVLLQAATEAERDAGYQLSEEGAGLLATLAAKMGCTQDELVRQVNVNSSVGENSGVATVARLLSNDRRPKMKQPTVGVLVALAEEYDAVQLMMSNSTLYRADGPGGSRDYLLGKIVSKRGGTHRIALARTSGMGNSSAAMRAAKLLDEFRGVEAVIMCGIAGGVPNLDDAAEHVRLGDIVVSDRRGVIQYDFGKQKGPVFEHRHSPRPPSAKLSEAVQNLEHGALAKNRPWDEHLRIALTAREIARPDTDVVLDKAGEPAAHPVDASIRPKVFLGPIASANCVQGDFRRRDRLRDEFKVKAVEMEGSGVADAAWEFEKAGYLVVRGICDYCDNRNKGRQTDIWKAYAAMVAAAYVRALLEAVPGSED